MNNLSGYNNIPGAPGNAAGIANAQFYNGPQYGQAQMPVGFAGKTLS